MGKFKDITGQKFGMLTALYKLNNYHKKGTYWLCVCDCGNLTEVRYDALGKTKSCGCLHKELTIKRSTKHGMYKSRLYRIYTNMIQRCDNKRSKNYKHYGGRGIVVCDKWKHDFMSFRDWAMDNGYQENLTIDRIDVNGNYEPDNCKWATLKQQAQNRRDNIKYTINGKTHCLKEWCEILDLNYQTIYKRIHVHNWPIEKALFNKTKFRGSSKWKHKRMEILKRDNYKCCICNNTENVQVHHIYALDIAPELKLENSNLITLCDKCHNDVHNNQFSTIYLTNLINEG